MTDPLRTQLSADALEVVERFEKTGGTWTFDLGDTAVTVGVGDFARPPGPAASLKIGTHTWIGRGRTLSEAVLDARRVFNRGS